MNTTTTAGRKPSAYDRWTARTSAALEQLLSAGDTLPLGSAVKPGVAGPTTARPNTGRYKGGNLFALHIFALIAGYAEHRWLGRETGNVASQPERINLSGCMYVEEQLRDLGTGRNGFVVMWFADCMNEVYEDGIKPAIGDAGYESVRIDRQEFLGNVPDEILAEIRKSRFVVADFTCCNRMHCLREMQEEPQENRGSRWCLLRGGFCPRTGHSSAPHRSRELYGRRALRHEFYQPLEVGGIEGPAGAVPQTD